MYVYIKSSKEVDVTKLPGIVGKFLNNRLDGSYSFKRTSNSSEVKSTILYQIPIDVSKKYNLSKSEREQVNVMDVLVSTTTYSNKVRVEVVELSPEEKTIGFRTFAKEKFKDVHSGCQEVLAFVAKSVRKEFEGYDVLF